LPADFEQRRLDLMKRLDRISTTVRLRVTFTEETCDVPA